MTQAQQLANSFYEASSLFNDDVRALAIALGGMLKKAGKKGDVEYVLRELEAGRLDRFAYLFQKVHDINIEEIEQCKAYAHCRFAKLLGQMEEVEKLSKHTSLLPQRLKAQEIVNINALIESLNNIKDNF